MKVDTKQIKRKGRFRPDRGWLKNFDDLPIVHQNNFKLIKSTLIEQLSEKINVYIFGSFHWGFWDDQSDYDVKVFDVECDTNKLSILFNQDHNISVNILPITKTGLRHENENTTKLILIP